MAEIKQHKPFANGIWKETENGIVLLGSKCKQCGEVYFPPKDVAICSHCQSEEIETIELSKEGTIYSYTAVHQAPAGGFYHGQVPFNYALIELPEKVLVQAHVICAEEDLKIGAKVRLVLDTLYEDEENVYDTYKFELVK